MISYLKGKIVSQTADYIILNVQGVGYKVFVAPSTKEQLAKEKGEVELFCFLHARENSLELFGLASPEQLKVFEMAEKISGIGPRAALQIASLGSLDQLHKAVASRDESFFRKVHGMGKKKIQKLIVELTGKLDVLDQKEVSEKDREAIEALGSLGFSQREAKKALEKVSPNIEGAEARVREALRLLRW